MHFDRYSMHIENNVCSADVNCRYTGKLFKLAWHEKNKNTSIALRATC